MIVSCSQFRSYPREEDAQHLFYDYIELYIEETDFYEKNFYIVNGSDFGVYAIM